MLTRENSDPLYLQLKNALKQRVRSGEYPPASRLPSQVVLSKTFGVSQITVQRALAELVEEGLLVARPGSGTYVVDRQQLAVSNRPRSIGIIFQDVVGGYPLIALLLRAVRQACRELGYAVQMLEVPDASESSLADIEAAGLSGAILTSPVSVNWLHWLQQHGVPYVLLHNDVVDGTSHCVSCNYALGVMLACRHLFEQRCQRLALVTAEETRYSARQMAMGFQMAHLAADRPCDPAAVITAQYTQAAGFDVVQQWARENAMPDGIIFASEQMARGGLEALVRLNLCVPRDVAVVGFGDAQSPADTPVALSMVDTHNDRTGRAAIDLLEQLLQGQQPAAHRLLIDPDLVVRASSQRQ